VSVDELKRVLEPPEEPNEAPRPEDWSAVEERLGTPLPGDYKTFIEAYGTGRIDNFLWVYNPFAANENLNLLKEVQEVGEIYAELGRGGHETPPPFFPSPGGLLPLGATDNGDFLFWKVSGPPDTWTIVVNESRAPEYEEFDGGLSAFLVAILNGGFTSKIFPDDFPSEAPGFKPAGRAVG